jgi:hypothetical protein
MKNFLIPTTLKEDTIDAVKLAVYQAKESDCEIILMIVSEVPDTYSASSFLRTMRVSLTKTQEEVLDVCRLIAASSDNCKIKIHNQYGISSPIFKNLITAFSVKLVILPHSYKQETKRIHNHLVQLAGNQKCPILHLSSEPYKDDFNKALYIENVQQNLHVKDIQQFISDNFSFEIVSQTKNFDDNYKEFAPHLIEVISKNHIDLLVQTRKAEKIKFTKTKNETINDLFGLPVLSLYEELV